METLIILKPGWEKKDQMLFWVLQFIALYRIEIITKRTIKVPIKFWESLYSDHTETDYFPTMIEHLSSSQSMFLILKGDDGVVELVRSHIVKIRDRYGKDSTDVENLLHAPNSIDEAEKEIKLFNEFFSKE